jgi:hypothetical protein
MGTRGPECDRNLPEIQLDHKTGDATEMAYLHTDLLDERREMMEAWDRFLTGATS